MLREFGIDGSLTHSSSGKKSLKTSSDLAIRPKTRTSGLQSAKQVFRRNTTATSRRASDPRSGDGEAGRKQLADSVTTGMADAQGLDGLGERGRSEGGVEGEMTRRNAAEPSNSRMTLIPSTSAQRCGDDGEQRGSGGKVEHRNAAEPATSRTTLIDSTITE